MGQNKGVGSGVVRENDELGMKNEELRMNNRGDFFGGGNSFLEDSFFRGSRGMVRTCGEFG